MDDAKKEPANDAGMQLLYPSRHYKRDAARHIISLLLENEPGALSRVAGLFSARGYNIESLNVAPTEEPSISRMTVVTTGPAEVVEQITKQLNKLVDVVKLLDITESAHVEREVMLLKLRAVGEARDELKRLADIFRGRVIDVTGSMYIIELTGTAVKLEAFIENAGPKNVVEVVRSGALGIGRGDRALRL